MEELIRAIGALLVVLAAILGLGYALRRYASGRANAIGERSDLSILEWRGLDSRRKLAVIRWDGREHLLCLGPSGDSVIASRTVETKADSQGNET